MPMPVGAEHVATGKAKAVLHDVVHLVTVNVTHLHVLRSLVGLKGLKAKCTWLMIVPLCIF